MANIRAYKLAEELGIDRNEIVEKAAAVGIELKSAMAALDEDQADELRSKLGGTKKKIKKWPPKRGSCFFVRFHCIFQCKFVQFYFQF